MAFDGSGTFSRLYNWVADRDAAIKILAARLDGEDDGFATGLGQTLLRDGRAAMTGTLAMGANKITGLASGAVGAPAIAFNSAATTGFYYTGTSAAIAVGGAKVLDVLTTGVAVTGTFTASGAATLNILSSSGATITGGTITGITDLAVADGGTGSSTAAAARTALGAAASGANTDITSITITGGTITGITDLAVADGGTGSSTAAAARTALGAAALGANADITSLETDTELVEGGTISATTLGFRGLPPNAKTGAYTLALTDQGKIIPNTTGGWVIPANASVAFPIGSTIALYNNSASTQALTITTDTLRLAGTTSTGTRTIGIRGLATLVKVNTTEWVVSGSVT